MTATERPRFRTDLVAEPIDDGGLRFIDVLDPDSGNGFRFFEVEYSIACAMDGERDVAGLVRWAREELGLEPSAKEIGTVINTLGDLGYLEGGAAAGEPELVRGVVAGPPQAFARAPDVELGHAGQSYGGRTIEDLPVPDELELGTAGGGRAAPIAARDEYGAGPELGPAGSRDHMARQDFDTPTPPPAEMPSASLRPIGRPDAEEDGPTNLPTPRAMDYEDDEVSVDLSDHLAISASDVKEAVRASKVMKAVDVPSDVLEQLEADEARAREDAAAAAAARSASAAEAARLEMEREEAARATAAAEREQIAREAMAREAREQAAREVASRPVSDLPQIPVGVSRKRAVTESPKEPEAPKPTTPVAAPSSGARRAVWLLLVLAITVAGAYYVWTKVLKKPLPWEPKDQGTAEVGTGGPRHAHTPPPGPVKPPPPAPAPPPPPSAVLAEKAGEVSAIVAGQAAVLSFVIADGSQVATGDPVLRFSGNAADEQKMLGYNYDIDIRYPKQIDAATKLKNKAGAPAAVVKAQDAKIAEVTHKLEQRKAERDALSAKLDGLTIKAPIAGVVKLADKIAKGVRTTADQSVASVTAPATLAATFTVPAGGKVYTTDASVRVSVKATPDQKANCTTTAVEAGQNGASTVTVVCPADAGIVSGTEILLD